MASAPQEKLTRNAFRILGLTAGASQMQVDSAARMMRLYVDPAEIPPTPNDLRYLGPLSRTAITIEDAISRLVHPESRVQERLWWFFTLPPETPERHPLPAPTSDAGIESVHAHGLARFTRLCRVRTEESHLHQWKLLLDSFDALSRSTDFHSLLLAAESAGDFEKRATESEISAAIAAMPEPAAAVLVDAAQDGVIRKAVTVAGKILTLLAGVDSCAAACKTLSQRLEDQLVSACRQALADIDSAWKAKQIPPLQSAACDAHMACVNGIEPLMHLLLQNAPPDAPDAAARIKDPVIHLLSYIAKAYDACFDYVAAEAILLRALAFAQQTPTRAIIENHLQRIRPLAEKLRRESSLYTMNFSFEKFHFVAARKSPEDASDRRDTPLAEKSRKKNSSLYATNFPFDQASFDKTTVRKSSRQPPEYIQNLTDRPGNIRLLGPLFIIVSIFLIPLMIGLLTAHSLPRDTSSQEVDGLTQETSPTPFPATIPSNFEFHPHPVDPDKLQLPGETDVPAPLPDLSIHPVNNMLLPTPPYPHFPLPTTLPSTQLHINP